MARRVSFRKAVRTSFAAQQIRKAKRKLKRRRTRR